MPLRHTHRPVISLEEMNDALVDLIHRGMWRWDDRTSYRLCDLWSMQEPPERLEKTAMADELDHIVGFHLSEEELRKAYKHKDTTVSAFYLFNLMLHEQELRSADYARRMEEASEKKNGKRGK
jgi:hypothetical protein